MGDPCAEQCRRECCQEDADRSLHEDSLQTVVDHRCAENRSIAVGRGEPHQDPPSGADVAATGYSRSMRIRTLLAATLAAGVVLSLAPAATGPGLAVVTKRPLTIKGMRFHARERVTVTAMTAIGPRIAGVTADGDGRFRVILRVPTSPAQPRSQFGLAARPEPSPRCRSRSRSPARRLRVAAPKAVGRGRSPPDGAFVGAALSLLRRPNLDLHEVALLAALLTVIVVPVFGTSTPFQPGW